MVTLLASLVLADITAQSFKISAAVGPVPKVLAQISETTKLPLRAHPSLSQEVIGLGTPELPLSEIMGKMSQTMEATWARDGAGYLLYRTDAQIKARKQREIEALTKQIQKRMVELRASVDPAKPFDEAAARALATAASAKVDTNSPQWYANRQKLEVKAPTHRLLSRILLNMSAQSLAQVEADSRVVLSTNPTRMQGALGNQASGLIRDFINEQNRYADALAGMSSDETMMFGMGGLAARKPIKEIGKVLLIISRNSEFSENFTVEVKVANPKGKYVAAAQTSLAFNPFGDGDPFKPTAVKDDDLRIEASPASKGMMDLFKQMQMTSSPGYQRQPTLNADLKNFLLRPDLFDPVEMGNLEAIQTLVEKKQQPVMLVLSDLSFFGVITAAADGKFTRSRWESGFKMAGLESVEDPKWMLVRGANPLSMERNRLDRTALARFLTRASKEGRVSLDNMSQMTLSIKGSTNSSIFPLYLILIGQGADVGLTTDPFALKFYASLSADQKRFLADGKVLDRNGLTPTQVQLLADRLYKNNRFSMGMTVEAEPEEADGDYNFLGNLNQEPTEACPLGLPMDIAISATVKQGESLFNKSDGMFASTREVDESSIAWDIFQRERADLFPYVANMPPMKEFVRGTQNSWSFRFEITPKLVFAGQVRDDILGKETTTLAQMSPEFKKKVEDQIKQYRESYKDSKPGDFGQNRGSVIPPLQR